MTTDAFFLARFGKSLIQQLKANSAHMDNDATDCYGRIIVSLGMIACCCLGMPPSAYDPKLNHFDWRNTQSNMHTVSLRRRVPRNDLWTTLQYGPRKYRLLSSGLDLSCLYSMRSTEWPWKITSLASSLRIFSMRLLLHHGILVLL